MVEFTDFLMGENRFASLKNSDPERAEKLFHEGEQDSKKRLAFYRKLHDLLEELL